MNKKAGLGKGLSALFPTDEHINSDTGEVQTENQNPEHAQDSESSIHNLEINLIDPNYDQPRKQFNDESLIELADSIKSSGIIQPLIVCKNADRYKIVAGERRWRAAKIAGHATVPAVIRDYSTGQLMQIALIENIQRADLNPIEEARGIKSLIDEHKLTQEEVAKILGKSRPVITNSLRILKLPEDILNLIQEGQLSSGHARCLVSLQDANMQLQVASEIMRRSLSVRQTELLCKEKLKGADEKKPKTSKTYPELFEVENQLQIQLETKVKISGNLNRGRISIEYYSEEQLERIYDYLRQES